MSINLKKTIASFKEECKEYSLQQKTISDAWGAIETLSDLTYEQAVEILKILKPEKKD